MKDSTKGKIVGTAWMLYILTAAILGIFVDTKNENIWKIYGLISIVLIALSSILFTLF